MNSSTQRQQKPQSTTRRRTRKQARQEGSALIVLVGILLVIGILGAAMGSLLATSSDACVLGSFSTDALWQSESGARSVIAHVVNTFYNPTSAGSPEDALGALGTYTKTTDCNGTRLTLDAPLILSLTGGGRAISVDVEYNESVDETTGASLGRFRVVSTGMANPPQPPDANGAPPAPGAATAYIRQAFEFSTGSAPGPEQLFDWVIYAGEGGFSTSSTPSGVDSVSDSDAYSTNPSIKPGDQVPTDADGTPIIDENAILYSLGSVTLGGGSELYCNVVTSSTITEGDGDKILGSTQQGVSVDPKLPVQDLGNGKSLVDYADEHSLTFTTSGNTFTSTVGTLPAGTWRHDGPMILDSKKNSPITISGDVTLFVAGDFSTTSQSNIVIAQGGGSLSLVVSGDITLATGTRVNEGGSATDMRIFGTATCENVTLSGCPAFVGVIYAPTAHVLLSGTTSILGSICGNEVELSGNIRLTFDSSLADYTGIRTGTTWHTQPTRHLRALVVQ